MTADERRLLRLYRGLPAAQRTGLLDYAEYLASRAIAEADEKPRQPLPIPRPAEESVIKRSAVSSRPIPCSTPTACCTRPPA